MIAYGCAVGSQEKFERFALPWIERARDPEAPLIEIRGADSIFTAYNEILDRLEADSRIELAVLLHEDTEVRDRFFEEKLRWAFRDPEIAIVGTIGAIGVQGIDWWVHEDTLGSSILDPIDPEVLYQTSLLTGSEVSGMGGTGPVDMVDGYLLAFSRWGVEELRFDEELAPGFHGYDADICFEARSLGRKVLAMEMEVAHRRNSVGPGPYREQWIRAQIEFRRKWEARGMLSEPVLPAPPY